MVLWDMIHRHTLLQQRSKAEPDAVLQSGNTTSSLTLESETPKRSN